LLTPIDVGENEDGKEIANNKPLNEEPEISAKVTGLVHIPSKKNTKNQRQSI
jgi:hypothetical protein